MVKNRVSATSVSMANDLWLARIQCIGPNYVVIGCVMQGGLQEI